MQLVSTQTPYTRFNSVTELSRDESLPFSLDSLMDRMRLGCMKDDNAVRTEVEGYARDVISMFEGYTGMSITNRRLALHYHCYKSGSILKFAPIREVVSITDAEGSAVTGFTSGNGLYRAINIPDEGVLHDVVITVEAGFNGMPPNKLPNDLEFAIKTDTALLYDGNEGMGKHATSILNKYKRLVQYGM